MTCMCGTCLHAAAPAHAAKGVRMLGCTANTQEGAGWGLWMPEQRGPGGHGRPFVPVSVWKGGSAPTCTCCSEKVSQGGSSSMSTSSSSSVASGRWAAAWVGSCSSSVPEAGVAWRGGGVRAAAAGGAGRPELTAAAPPLPARPQDALPPHLLKQGGLGHATAQAPHRAVRACRRQAYRQLAVSEAGRRDASQAMQAHPPALSWHADT
jgi:hypothetical protein